MAVWGISIVWIVMTLAPSPSYAGPCVICNCTGRVADCSSRGLDNIPTEVPNDVTGLNLNNNSIRELQNYVFANFTKLRTLDLSTNKLCALSEDVFAGLGGLQSLNLSWNNLSLNPVTYPPGVFMPFRTSLLDLRLSGNVQSFAGEDMSYPDLAISLLSTLEILYIDGLPGVVFGPGFANLTAIKNISLSGVNGVGFCGISNLTNETFINIPPSLTNLNMSNCSIASIDANTFRPLNNLDTLDLSYNVQLGFSTLGTAMFGLQGSALRELRVNHIIPPYSLCVIICKDATRHFRNTNIQRIFAENNRLELFEVGALENMPDSLNFVSVTGNRFGFGNYFRDFGKLRNITFIMNDGTLFAADPPNVYPSKEYDLDQCPSSQKRAVEEEYIDFRSPGGPRAINADHFVFTLPPKLTTYTSRWNQLHYKLTEINFDPKNSLTYLNLNNNLLSTWIGPIRGLSSLTSLHLSNNFASVVSKEFFSSFPSLVSLHIQRNSLRDIIASDQSGWIFQDLRVLEILHLSENYINQLHPELLAGLVSLRVLNMSHNEIFEFGLNISHMMNLSLIDLSYNSIKYLPQSITDHLKVVATLRFLRNLSALTVNMFNNGIACTCEHFHFLTFIVDTSTHVHFEKAENYSCLMADGTIQNVVNFIDVIADLQMKCKVMSGIFVGAVTVSLCLVIALASALVYRFRWKLRYLYYASRLAYKHVHTEQFQFDAFVSYAKEDDDFVHGELMKQLESRAHLRLIVHDRDFVPGRPVQCNIVAAVQNSRRTLVVLTRHLLNSSWCQYEMQMATMESAHTGRDVLLFLLYEDIPSHELPRQVLYNLQASTYIQFPHEEPTMVTNFWLRLVQAIED